MRAVAKRYSPSPVVDHTAQHSADFGFPADEPAPILRLDFARAISPVAGTIARALFQGPSQDSASEADTRIVGPGQWQWTEIECPIPIARRCPRWSNPNRRRAVHGRSHP